MAKPIEQLDDVIIRFAGDSGDGMQLTGGRFTSETALFGNDLSTLPDFPAEIRAPAGSLPGVSGFQIHYADHDILTPGDAPHVLVAMNPAALRKNIRDLPNGGTLIVNSDAFNDRNLQKAGYTANPLEDGSLDEVRVHEVPLTSLTLEAVKGTGLSNREAERSKNMFALGLMSWLYTRPTEGTVAFLNKSSPSGPRSPRRTCAPSRRVTRSARRARASRCTTRSRPRRCRRGRTGTSRGTRLWRSGSSPPPCSRSCRSS